MGQTMLEIWKTTVMLVLNLENNIFQKISFSVNRVTREAVLLNVLFLLWQECETKIAQEIASLSKEDVSKEEMNENEEVINILLAQVAGRHLPVYLMVFSISDLTKLSFVPSDAVGPLQAQRGLWVHENTRLCFNGQWSREGMTEPGAEETLVTLPAGRRQCERKKKVFVVHVLRKHHLPK